VFSLNFNGPVYADSAGIQRLGRELTPVMRNEFNRYAGRNGGTAGIR
jgi:hypothetical protein